MKKNQLSLLLRASMILLAFVFVFSACKKDDDDNNNNPPAVEDGIYVRGGSTALTDLTSKGLLKSTRNEVNQSDRAELMELYVAIKSGEPGFNIVEVVGGQPKVYGPGADFGVVAEADRNVDEPKVDFWRGSYTETATAFTVPADGLYHVVIDTEYDKIVIAPVVWGLIGAATPNGWSGSTAMTPSAFDLNTMSFEINDMIMTKADFKFRYSDGWKIIIDTTEDLGGGAVGVRVNTNFGGAVDALVPGGANIVNDTPGKYTAKMTWNLGQPWVATVTKTGDLDAFNYTDTELGLVGDGLMVDGVQHNWDETIMLSKPIVENVTNYTWTWEGVEITTAGSFKIREGQDWSKKSIGYNDVTMAGLSAGDFETNGDGNFVPKVDGTFDFELKIDAVTETYTLTVNPVGVAVEMYLLGDGSLAGWDNNAALPMQGSDGNYTITTELQGAGKYIKFITTLGQWAPMYGTDANGTSTAGTLVYRATESDPDPTSIPAPDAVGQYTITLNTNALTYTIAPAKK